MEIMRRTIGKRYETVMDAITNAGNGQGPRYCGSKSLSEHDFEWIRHADCSIKKYEIGSERVRFQWPDGSAVVASGKMFKWGWSFHAKDLENPEFQKAIRRFTSQNPEFLWATDFLPSVAHLEKESDIDQLLADSEKGMAYGFCQAYDKNMSLTYSVSLIQAIARQNTSIEIASMLRYEWSDGTALVIDEARKETFYGIHREFLDDPGIIELVKAFEHLNHTDDPKFVRINTLDIEYWRLRTEAKK